MEYNMMEGKTKIRKEPRVKKNELTIDIVSGLGGTKDDLQLLSNIAENSDSDYDCPDIDMDADPVGKNEIREFMKQLEIFKYRPSNEEEENTENKKAKKKKLLVSKATEDAGTQSEVNKSPSASFSEEWKHDRTKKKAKNKFKLQHDEVSSTTKDPAAEYRQHIKAYQMRKYLLVKAGEYFDNSMAATVSDSERFSDSMVKEMEAFAAKLLQDEISVYNKQKENAKRSDARWMKTVLTSGTLVDKIAALTLLLQESPVHNLHHFDTLLNMAKKKGTRENTQAADALKELFLTELLPSDRKLKSFAQRPLSHLGNITSWNKDVMDKKLMLWYFEDQLKLKYSEFVKILQLMAHYQLLAVKQKTINIAYNLLLNKPEQEKALLELLINKVGDPNYKMASSVAQHLTKLVENHPNMKSVVVREVEHLLYRPNISVKAQYYCVCFLNQLRLKQVDKDLATKLVQIYFSFFQVFIKKGEIDSKMMSALLSGVNRAYPFAKLDDEFMQEQLEHLYRMVHIVNFNTSLQALMLLYHVMDTSQNISERFYSALYKKLADPALKTSSKQVVFLNLLFKSLKKDESGRRIKAFIKRLLQVCLYQQPQFTCGALLLLSEVLKEKPGLLSISHTQQDSDDEEHFVDITDSVDGQEDDDSARDLKLETDIKTEPGNEEKHIVENKQEQHVAPTWVHRTNLNHKTDKVDYDPFHRNPQYCHAETECIWELENLAEHFHPSVALFAKQLLMGQSIRYGGDPLQDFTLMRFLDRFVYKNPKKKELIEEKMSTLSWSRSVPRGIKSVPVTSEQFVKLDEKKIPVDDIFLHRFFKQKAVTVKSKKSKDDSDAESDVDDDEFEEFLDKYEGQLEEKDFGDFDIDFSSEFGKKKGIGGNKGDDSDEDDVEDDLDDDLSEEEMDFEDDELAKEFKDEMEGMSDGNETDDGDDFADAEDFADDFADDTKDDDANNDEMGFNEEEVEFSDNDGEFKGMMTKGKKRAGNAMENDSQFPHKMKKRMKDSDGLFAAAEEFGNLIDESSASQIDMSGTDALSTNDKADAKQLKWEIERDRWIKGGDRHNFRKKGKKSIRGKWAGNKSHGKKFQKPGTFKKTNTKNR